MQLIVEKSVKGHWHEFGHRQVCSRLRDASFSSPVSAEAIIDDSDPKVAPLMDSIKELFERMRNSKWESTKQQLCLQITRQADRVFSSDGLTRSFQHELQDCEAKTLAS